ncbi:MAG: hypothetical protein RR449_01505 [Christensenella sp.]
MNFLDFVGNGIKTILNAIFAFLPDSPFTMLAQNDSVSSVIGYLNYFIPVDFMIATLQLWLVAVGIFYIYQAILRWAKAIE